MDRNFTLKFKDLPDGKSRDQENLNITSTLVPINGCYRVDIWDIRKDYHSLKPLESYLKELEDVIKSSDDQNLKDKLKSRLSEWRKYGNKLIEVKIDEFDSLFEIIRCTYPNRRSFSEKISIPTWKDGKITGYRLEDQYYWGNQISCSK